MTNGWCAYNQRDFVIFFQYMNSLNISCIFIHAQIIPFNILINARSPISTNQMETVLRKHHAAKQKAIRPEKTVQYKMTNDIAFIRRANETESEWYLFNSHIEATFSAHLDARKPIEREK